MSKHVGHVIRNNCVWYKCAIVGQIVNKKYFVIISVFNCNTYLELDELTDRNLRSEFTHSLFVAVSLSTPLDGTRVARLRFSNALRKRWNWKLPREIESTINKFSWVARLIVRSPTSLVPSAVICHKRRQAYPYAWVTHTTVLVSNDFISYRISLHLLSPD